MQKLTRKISDFFKEWKDEFVSLNFDVPVIVSTI